MASLKDEMLAEAQADAKRLAAEARDNITVTAHQVQERAGEVAAPFVDVGHNFRIAIKKSAITQPTVTLAVAAGLGFILGAIWRG